MGLFRAEAAKLNGSSHSKGRGRPPRGNDASIFQSAAAVRKQSTIWRTERDGGGRERGRWWAVHLAKCEHIAMRPAYPGNSNGHYHLSYGSVPTGLFLSADIRLIMNPHGLGTDRRTSRVCARREIGYLPVTIKGWSYGGAGLSRLRTKFK